MMARAACRRGEAGGGAELLSGVCVCLLWDAVGDGGSEQEPHRTSVSAQAGPSLRRRWLQPLGALGTGRAGRPSATSPPEANARLLSAWGGGCDSSHSEESGHLHFLSSTSHLSLLGHPLLKYNPCRESVTCPQCVHAQEQPTKPGPGPAMGTVQSLARAFVIQGVVRCRYVYVCVYSCLHVCTERVIEMTTKSRG